MMLPLASFADDDDDDDRDRDYRHAREAVRAGRIVPLERILADAQRSFRGEVIDVELDDDEYRIELLLRDGRVVELEYDARSGRRLDVDIDDDEYEDDD